MAANGPVITPLTRRFVVERVTRIELALSAWEADVLPLNYTRAGEHEDTGPRWGTGSSSRHRTGDLGCEQGAHGIDEDRWTHGREEDIPLEGGAAAGGRSRQARYRTSPASSWLTPDMAVVPGLGCRAMRA
jgi:hypothetical protein